MTDNIFMAIENYLAKSDGTLEQLKECSQKLVNDVYIESITQTLTEKNRQIAQLDINLEPTEYRKNVNKILGKFLVHHLALQQNESMKNKTYSEAIQQQIAEVIQQLSSSSNLLTDKKLARFIDHLHETSTEQTILADKVRDMAFQAYSESSRLMPNPHHITEFNTDSSYQAGSAYIFRLTCMEEKKIEDVLSELAQGADGLKYVVENYLLRPSESSLSYCNTIEAVIRKHTTIMKLKADELHEHKEIDTFTVLHNAHSTIVKICQEIPLSSNIGFSKEQLDTIAKCLAEASESPHIKSHPVIEKKILHNFLLVLSSLGVLGLALTAKNRGSFWHHPEQDTDNKLDEMKPSAPR